MVHVSLSFDFTLQRGPPLDLVIIVASATDLDLFIYKSERVNLKIPAGFRNSGAYKQDLTYSVETATLNLENQRQYLLLLTH